MKIRKIGLLIPIMVSVVMFAGCSSNTVADGEQGKTNARLKAEVIKSEGKHGTIEEERVKAMSSETRYVPAGSKNGYNLIDPSLADPKENAHRDPEQLVIPSITIGRW